MPLEEPWALLTGWEEGDLDAIDMQRTGLFMQETTHFQSTWKRNMRVDHTKTPISVALSNEWIVGTILHSETVLNVSKVRRNHHELKAHQSWHSGQLTPPGEKGFAAVNA